MRWLSGEAGDLVDVGNGVPCRPVDEIVEELEATVSQDGVVGELEPRRREIVLGYDGGVHFPSPPVELGLEFGIDPEETRIRTLLREPPPNVGQRFHGFSPLKSNATIQQ